MNARKKDKHTDTRIETKAETLDLKEKPKQKIISVL